MQEEESITIQEPNYIELISKNLNIGQWQVQTVLNLTSEWATVPFISRYRKEQTNNLDENQIREILELRKKEKNLHLAKQKAINWIHEQWKLTNDLQDNILNCQTLKEVEEIYKPYKSKKKTKAMIAIEKWFEPVAHNLLNNILQIPDELLQQYAQEEILEWAVQIIASWISSNSQLRHKLLNTLYSLGSISSSYKSEKMLEKLNPKEKSQIPKFEIYKNFTIQISKIKPYQTLALNRWESLGILNVKILKDEDIFAKIQKYYLNSLEIKNQLNEYLLEWFKTWYNALFESVERQIRSELTEKAHDEAIVTFQQNLKSLLMTKPQYWQKILAIDPWFKTWCKITILDELGDPQTFDKVYLEQKQETINKILDLTNKYNIQTIVIWNWTWNEKLQELINNEFEGDIYIVNESGASVYSVSKTAKEEFPNYQDVDIWTISIGRRFIDPLAELVKVPVGSIWVGLYQHDIPNKKLEEKLNYVVEDCVNNVGININTASIHLLNHISWINKTQAKKIFNNKPYQSRQELQKILGPKAYQQAIWFLRVPESSETLDNTDIHPEQYQLAKYIISNNKTQPDDQMPEMYPDVTQTTIDFIRKAYKNIGNDPRTNFAHQKAQQPITIEQLKEWDMLQGIVRNVVAFGAFVDVGLKNDWLVHISELANEFVSNPMDIVKVGDTVDVKVIWIDEENGKVQLSMKDS